MRISTAPSGPLGARRAGGTLARHARIPTAAWLLVFAALVLATQVGALEVEVIDWDESTFMLVASDLLRGNLPYVGLFDNKPPMIFLSLAGAMYLFGESLPTVRLFGDATLLVVAVATFAIARRTFGDVPAAVAVCAMIAASAVPMGRHTQTEHLAMAFVMPALWLTLARRDKAWAAALAGALLSLAVLTRLNLAYVVIVLGLWHGWGLLRGPTRLHRASVLYYAVGGAVPLALLLAVYARQGALDTLLLANIAVPLAYSLDQQGIWANLLEHVALWKLHIRRFPVIYAPLSLLIGLGILGFAGALAAPGGHDRKERREDLLLIGTVLAATLASVLMSGAAYAHYWNQLLPFAAIAIAAGLHLLGEHRPAWVWLPQAMSALAVGAALATYGPASWRVATQWPAVERSHDVRRAAERIAEARQPGETIWAAQRHLVLWYLGERPLSPVLAHPSNLFRRAIVQTLADNGYASPREADLIFDSKPDFIVQGPNDIPYYMELEGDDEPVAARYTAFRAANYDLWYENGQVRVYRRRADPTRSP